MNANKDCMFKNIFLVPLFLLLSVLLFGCSPTSMLIRGATVASRASVNTKTPTGKEKDIELYIYKKCEKKYKVLKDLEVKKYKTAGAFSSMPKNEKLDELLKIEASKIQANAVIEISYETFTDLVGSGKLAKGKAIRYLVEE